MYTASQVNACLNLDKAQNVIRFPLHPVLVIKNKKKDKTKQRAIRSVSLSNRLSAWILGGLLLLRPSVIDSLQVTNCSRSGCCFCLLSRDTLMFYVLPPSLSLFLSLSGQRLLCVFFVIPVQTHYLHGHTVVERRITVIAWCFRAKARFTNYTCFFKIYFACSSAILLVGLWYDCLFYILGLRLLITKLKILILMLFPLDLFLVCVRVYVCE